MKYHNGKKILPNELLEQIQEFVQGEYIYIPKKNTDNVNTEYRKELAIRNSNIYEMHCEGQSNKNIAHMYNLSIKSIQRIIREEVEKAEIKTLEVKKIAGDWCKVTCVKQIYTSAWEINNSYVIKRYDDLEELNRNINMIRALAANNIPVPIIIPTSEGRDYAEQQDEYYIMTSKLHGSGIVDVNLLDNEWFYNLGKIIGDLHGTFVKCQNEIDCYHNCLLGEMKSWVSDNLKRYTLKNLSLEEVQESIHKLEKNYDKLKKQLIHRDMHLGNFVFDNGILSGYVDFDLSQINIRIFDICYLCLSLLLEKDHYKIKEERWFTVVAEIVRGYHEKVKLTVEERKKIPIVMENIELLFAAWFCQENDFVAASEAVELFQYIKKNERKIQMCV